MSTFRRIRNKVTASLRLAERQHLQTLHRDIHSDASTSSNKNFWTCVKRISGKVKGSSIPALISTSPHGPAKSVSSDEEKADVLNKYFAEQTCLSNIPSSFPDLSTSYPDSVVADSIQTYPTEVYDCLTHLKPGKAPGPDDFPSCLLRLCAPGIASSLCALFNRSFNEGSVPSEWKVALVVPVFKSGSKSSPCNYRPVALLSIISKVMEKIVYRRLNAFLSPILTKKQSGFRKGDSTNMQLVRLVQEWSTAIDSSKLVGVVFLDLKKAFDHVCLPGLLNKLNAVGVRGKALAWFASFLLGRKQRTAVGRSLSPIADLHAGVPQGAILSPLLFSLYMNDIVEATGADINLFADNTSVCVTDSSPCVGFSRKCSTLWKNSLLGFPPGHYLLITRSLP